MAKFKEYCNVCGYVSTDNVGDSFDRAFAWYCNKAPYNTLTTQKCIDSYRDEKDGPPEIPKWCPLPNIKR